MERACPFVCMHVCAPACTLQRRGVEDRTSIQKFNGARDAVKLRIRFSIFLNFSILQRMSICVCVRRGKRGAAAHSPSCQGRTTAEKDMRGTGRSSSLVRKGGEEARREGRPKDGGSKPSQQRTKTRRRIERRTSGEQPRSTLQDGGTPGGGGATEGRDRGGGERGSRGGQRLEDRPA